MKEFENKKECINYFKNNKIMEGINWIVIIPNQKELDEAYNKSRRHSLNNKICSICKSSFKFGDSRRKTCICKIFAECKICKKYYEITYLLNLNKDTTIDYLCSACNSKNNLKIANKILDKHPEIRSELGRKNIKFANLYCDKHPEIRCNNGKKNIKSAIKWRNDHPEESLIQTLQALEKGRNKLNWLWENNPEWASIMKNKLSENGKRTIYLARESKINKIKKSISNISLTINKNFIDINNIYNLRKNDICGAYIIKAKFKDNIETEKERIVYDLLVCKSVKVYNEIYWVLRVLSQPERQDKNAEWTIAKWWYIANLYYDFEFELLTDPNGVSEEDALLYEAKYAIDNNLFVEFKRDNDGNKVPNIKKHASWNI